MNELIQTSSDLRLALDEAMLTTLFWFLDGGERFLPSGLEGILFQSQVEGNA